MIYQETGVCGPVLLQLSKILPGAWHMIEPKLKEVGLRKDNYATMLSLRARSKIT